MTKEGQRLFDEIAAGRLDGAIPNPVYEAIMRGARGLIAERDKKVADAVERFAGKPLTKIEPGRLRRFTRQGSDLEHFVVDGYCVAVSEQVSVVEGAITEVALTIRYKIFDKPKKMLAT